MSHFSLAIFKILFLSLTFNSLTVMLVSLFLLVGGHWSSTVCISISFFRFGNFSAFISSSKLSLCMCFPSRTPSKYTLASLMISQKSFRYSSLFCIPLSLCFYLMISNDLCSRFVILLPSQLCFLISQVNFSVPLWYENFLWKCEMEIFSSIFQL